MRMVADGKFRTLFSTIREQGWRIEMTNSSHWRLIPPDATKPIVHTSGTPSDRRVYQNLVKQLRHSGAII